jgi:hypothetical protein
MLDHVTPVPLTPNEEQNIARALSYLAWAKDIVVIDNGSTDGTLDVLASLPNVRESLEVPSKFFGSMLCVTDKFSP